MDKRVVHVDPHGNLIHYQNKRYRPAGRSQFVSGEQVSVRAFGDDELVVAYRMLGVPNPHVLRYTETWRWDTYGSSERK